MNDGRSVQPFEPGQCVAHLGVGIEEDVVGVERSGVPYDGSQVGGDVLLDLIAASDKPVIGRADDHLVTSERV